jgi:uncharacterized protein YlbG (UPF0298 family)
MIHKLTYLKDAVGNNYVGINIPNEDVESHLEKLKEILGEEDFQIFTQNQKMRDHDHYHITVINVMDCNRLSKEMGMADFVKSVELTFEYPIEDLEMLGVGMASKSANTAYFIVCQSDSLDAVRTRFNLTKQDFHITLGFNTKDVFGVPKNVVIN